jgi:hypothetical protein
MAARTGSRRHADLLHQQAAGEHAGGFIHSSIQLGLTVQPHPN